MTEIIDARAAIIAILKADTDTSALVGTRVYGDEVPASETANWTGPNQARKSVVVAPAGGTPPTYTTATLPLEAQRLDVFCYGETLFQAERVRRAVYGALKAIERDKQGDVLVHWCRPAGGAAQGRDPDGDWPMKWNSWQVLADERTAA